MIRSVYCVYYHTIQARSQSVSIRPAVFLEAPGKIHFLKEHQDCRGDKHAEQLAAVTSG